MVIQLNQMAGKSKIAAKARRKSNERERSAGEGFVVVPGFSTMVISIRPDATSPKFVASFSGLKCGSFDSSACGGLAQDDRCIYVLNFRRGRLAVQMRISAICDVPARKKGGRGRLGSAPK
jgi:hypothetical protein